MSISPDFFRASGRTTRMLHRAGALVKEGKRVRVVGVDMGHARLLKRTWENLGYTASREIEFTSINATMFAFHVDEVLIDHYAYEVMLDRATQEAEKAPVP